ncbi:VirB4 family type IV secretion/conjugal transfer ATPase [Xanthomonas citri pv. citri]|uniref:VirB4 family type IV secretion/conjugal transfer ATPase n=1 Tax=Xanthomonas TaxID=338 RepID=UPI00034B5643|nr:MULTISPECIES: VirB4 family type IV secretion/conjugal transfer ATPase [Xanthomonas]MBD1524588.1 VirB4 family type IV secretion/conjugal transfer ATPase [Xanthomonas citri pv. citri]KEZ98459.1 conjugal transfer protein TrbE [Xanthomonas vasicola pv. vasculorum NCPPB 895]MBV7306579.1 VirB4 family type IV secretion/conjugal transfer ATPase [Xanthomonas vasicola pv. vasculorum]MDO6936091.1 VirB4 family type IV secretion/conjugal transfer ATPase [Xanthomonas vasicola]MDO6939972.1 VirB4 family ty
MLQVITIAIAVLGAVLLVALFSLVLRANADLRLQKHRSKDAGLADLLNYAAVVDDGVIVGKNGSFMASWFYRGADNASATEAERELISFRINQALAPLGNGWMVHVDAVRRPAPSYSDPSLSHFPDPVSAAIDEERRRLFESLGTLYEGFFIITVTWFPPILAERKFVELMFHDDADKPDQKRRTAHLIQHFKREVQNLEGRLSAAVELERLRGVKVMQEDGSTVTHDQQLQWLQFCVTGLNHPVQLPSNPMYIDSLIGGQELYTGVVPKIGRHFIQVVAIEGFPLESSPGILSKLAELPIEYRWASRFIFLDHHEAVSQLEKFRKKWKQKIRGFFDQVFNTNSSHVDEDAVSMVADAASAIAETNSGLVSQGYYTSVVVLMSENRHLVEASARTLEKAINALAFTARVETINTMDAYLGSLPGHGVENVRRPLLNTMNLADLLPTSTIWTGENRAPSPLFPPNAPPLLHGVTSGNSPMRINLHVRDLGHGIIFGPTRTGKSTKLGLIAFQWRRYLGARIYAFDKGLSMYPTCKAARGRHFTIASHTDKLAFAPLSRLDTRQRRAWAMEWIDTILALNGVITTPAQRNEIAQAIMSMHKSESRTLSEFTVTVQDEEIREALKPYTVDGDMRDLLDAEEDGLDLADFMTFEIEQLMRLDERFALPVLLYLFMQIEESLSEEDARPTLLILDEAWLMLAHPAFRDKIEEWLRSMAKKNCSVLMATQSISEAAKSGILDIITESTACRIFLANPNAREEKTAEIYGRLGLNKRQIEIIASAVPKRDYYYVSEKGRRLYQLALGPLALAFVGSTDKESIATIRKLEALHGEAWVHEWLRMKGLDLNDYGVAS